MSKQNRFFMIYFLQTESFDLKNPIGSIKIPKPSDYFDQNSCKIGKPNRFFFRAFKNTRARMDFSSKKTRVKLQWSK